jgi:sulfhydrogenase subunit beta (sulfur reductase)
MSLTLHTKDLEKLFTEIETKWPVFGVVEDQTKVPSVFRFEKLKTFSDWSPIYGQTIIPPKKYLLPALETLFEFKDNKVKLPLNKVAVLFGVNRKDGEGIFYLDKLMTEPIQEVNYSRRRKDIKLVIIDSLPPSNNLNCDLYLQRVDEKHFIVSPFSSFGEALIKAKYFEHDSEISQISTRHMPDEIVFYPNLDVIIENSKDSPVWDRLAKTCFNCGICSYVCPLCYCFEIDDQIDITKDANKCEGCRNRSWDSCMLPDFAKVTFHNFRPELKDRIYNWYYHKFVRMPREYGFPGCIDCGRCITFCPANINYREILKELINDSQK